MPKPQLLAVDTNVLIDYAADDEAVIDCFITISKKLPNSKTFVLPTVIQELADQVDTGGAKAKPLALKAIQSIIKPWGFCPINCIPVGHGITEETARKIRARGIIPDEEVNDALIVAEAALANVSLLLTNDSHIRDIDQAELKRLLESCDLPTPIIFSPHRIVREFFNSAH